MNHKHFSSEQEQQQAEEHDDALSDQALSTYVVMQSCDV